MPYKILVVEDDADSRFLYELFLAEVAAKVAFSESIQGALEHLANEWPHLVILDYNVANGDVAGFVARLRESTDSFPPRILLVSGEEDIVGIARSLRVDSHLRKPIDMDVFLRQVESLLRATKKEPTDDGRRESAEPKHSGLATSPGT